MTGRIASRAAPSETDERGAWVRIVSILVFGLVVGAAASGAALAFVELFGRLNDLLLVSPRSRMLAGDSTWVLVATIAVPACGGLVVGLLIRRIPARRPQTPADIIESVQGAAGQVPARTGMLNAAASLVALGCGASVGQYGPLAHMGATLGSVLARLGGRFRAMGAIGVACGVAAAISTAFNAPIAGILFAHEVVLRHYSLRAFAPVTVASTVGFVLANLVFERRPLFRIEELRVLHATEFFGFVLIGVLGALVAVVFMRAIVYCTRLAEGLAWPEYLKPMLAGLGVGLAGLWIPDILGIGRETLRFTIITGAFAPGELVLILVAKIVATAVCLGFGFAGGAFSPALLIGALFGALLGALADMVAPGLHSDLAIYAICGMVAVTSPVIGAPLTTILIVFELTRNYDLTTAAMVSVAFSNVVAYRVFGRSLFDVQLRERGFDLSFGRDKVILDRECIAPYVSERFTRLRATTSAGDAIQQMLAAGHTAGHVVCAEGRYLGTVKLPGLIAARAAAGDHDLPVVTQARPDAYTLTTGTSVWQAMESMRDFVGESIPVLRSESDQTLAGVVFESSIVTAYMDIMRRIRTEEHAAS